MSIVHTCLKLGASPLVLTQDNQVGLAACTSDQGCDAMTDDSPCRQQSMIARCDKLAYCIFTLKVGRSMEAKQSRALLRIKSWSMLSWHTASAAHTAKCISSSAFWRHQFRRLITMNRTTRKPAESTFSFKRKGCMNTETKINVSVPCSR